MLTKKKQLKLSWLGYKKNTETIFYTLKVYKTYFNYKTYYSILKLGYFLTN